jgi:D-alanyl-D-alanine carboxypeptidase/D-alanyl-D-alanine-endopeptidase (penicillin-binding protein 4)
MTSRTPRSVNRPLRILAVLAATAALAAAPALGAHAAPAAATTTTGMPAPKATAYTPTAADSRIAGMLKARVTTTRFGTSFTGAVVDAASGRVVWSKNGALSLMPASNTKWVTATDALAVFGPSHRFTTTVRLGGHANDVVLVGSGDPALSTAQLAALAKTTATAVKAKGYTSMRVYADDTLFPAPSLATGWRSSYIPTDTTWLRALVVDRRNATDTTMQTASVFAAQLKANGMTVSHVGRGTANPSQPLLASSAGQTVSQIVSTMMVGSDNEYAEALHRLVGIRLGYGRTWAAARSAQADQLVKQGLTATALYDGSGLSRSDRLSSLQLARMVTNIFEPGNATSLALLRSDGGLPISGRTGTLQASYGRFTTAASKCAVGLVHAKTGTLSDAAALSGWTVGTDGRTKAFSFVVNGRSATLALKQSLDMLAATVVGCY